MTKIAQTDTKSKGVTREVFETFDNVTPVTANNVSCYNNHFLFATATLQALNQHYNNSHSPLGNITSYSPQPEYQKVKLSESDVLNLKHDYKKENIQRKKKIGRKVSRVGYCGIRPIRSDAKFIDAVQGGTGGIYYRGMQRCGSVWLCPDCMYKLMKARAIDLYNQLNAYKEAGKAILFLTFTLQHHKGDPLQDLHNKLLQAFNFANKHKSWIKVKKLVPVEYLRTLEVLFGVNGWHPHLHCVFIGDPEIVNTINIFVDLFKKELSKQGLLVNDHTVTMDRWNGKLDDMKDYLFKGMIEQELTSGSLKKSGKGKTFFELIDEGNDPAVDEYIKVMKGKRQYHHSRGFFKDIRVRSDEEIIKDDRIEKVLFTIPIEIYHDIIKKGIALHLLNEYQYKGKDQAIKLLELYDCDAGFMDSS